MYISSKKFCVLALRVFVLTMILSPLETVSAQECSNRVSLPECAKVSVGTSQLTNQVAIVTLRMNNTCRYDVKINVDHHKKDVSGRRYISYILGSGQSFTRTHAIAAPWRTVRTTLERCMPEQQKVRIPELLTPPTATLSCSQKWKACTLDRSSRFIKWMDCKRVSAQDQKSIKNYCSDKLPPKDDCGRKCFEYLLTSSHTKGDPVLTGKGSIPVALKLIDDCAAFCMRSRQQDCQ